jgi:hypothetical protein
MSRSTFSGPVASTNGFIGALTGNVGNTTSAEIAARNDDSAMEETVIAAGAVSTTVAVTKLAVVGGGAVTLAAPTKPGFIKIIEMTTDDGDVTLALTNVVEGSAATTATFSAVGGRLVLVSNFASSGKWIVLKEGAAGITLT